MNPTRCVVIGGGISGLSFAHRLSELRRARGLSLEIVLLEAAGRLGGVIETRRRDGFLLEGGPDAFLVERPEAVALCRRLGLAGDLMETQETYRRSFVARKGRLLPVPSGLYLIAPGRLSTLVRMPLVSWPGKLRMACEPFIPARRDDQDESVGHFVRRRLGREALERLGQPMISGIYTADPERLSLEATFPRFREMERRYGSLSRGLRVGVRESAQAVRQASGPRYSLFLSLRGGLGTLVEALGRRMSDVDLRCGTPVVHVEREARWRVVATDGMTLEADWLCVALPAHQAAVLLRPCAPDLARQLAAIPYESVATVNAAFRRSDVPHPLDGFGFVVPAVERRRVVGCTFSSQKFAGRAPDGSVLLRAFVGGALHREVFELDDHALERVVREELRDLLGIQAAPRLILVHRYPQAMPQYHVGHLERVAAIEAGVGRFPGLFLIGNGFGGLGIPDCVRQAETAAERLAARMISGGN